MLPITLTEVQKDILRPLLNSYYYEADNYFKAFRNKSAENYEYYHGRLPAFPHESVIPLTDRTCKKQVSAALKDLTEIFLSNDHEPIQFVPENPETDNPALAMAATKLVRQAYDDNNGDRLFGDMLKESLINGTAFIKRYWGTKREVITTPAHGLQSEEEATGLILAWREGGLKIDDADIELNKNDDGTFDMIATYEGVFEGVEMYLAPIEEILFDQKARSINGRDGCTYFCHRVRKTKSELLEMGFTEEEVSTFDIDENVTDDYYNVNAARSDFMRYEDQDIGASQDDNAVGVWLKEHYIRTCLIESNKTPTLYKINECGGIIKDAEIVSEIPFTVFNPDPTPHQIMGEGLVDYTKDIQDKLSWIQRDALKHSQLAANPRWEVQEGEVDTRSLLNNVPNSVITVSNIGMIQRIDPPPMDQGVSLLLQIATDEEENRTGFGSTQQGNVTNALENGRQAEGSVKSMLELAQSKARNYGRNIANGGMRDLFLAVHRLIKENATQPISVLTAGGVMPVNPEQLLDRRFVRVNVALTSQEKTKQFNNLMQLAQFQQMVDPNGTFKQPQNIAYMLYEATKALGFPNYYDYNTPLELYQPPQPSPVDQLQMQKMQVDINYVDAQAKSLVQKAHDSAERQVMDGQISADDSMRKDKELEFLMQSKADEHYLEAQRIQRDREQDAMRQQQHIDKHAVDEQRANTQELQAQGKVMLESRKQTLDYQHQA